MRQEIKIGITVITAVLIAFIGFKILQDNPIFRSTHLLYSNFETVDGLTTGSYIYVKGVKVGSVSSMILNEDLTVKVGLNFTDLTTIPIGTAARLVDLDFLGTKGVLIDLGKGTALAYGEEIPGGLDSSSIDALTESGQKLMDQVDPALVGLNEGIAKLNLLLSADNRDNVAGILGNVKEGTAELSSVLKENQQELSKSVSHVANILSNVDSLTTDKKLELNQLITNLETSTRGLDNLIASTDSLANSLDRLLLKIDTGEGTLARLVNDSSLYVNVNDMSFEIARMLKKMNEDPKYFFKHVKIRLF
jgi:phospholipid/cholesterol/gamma-HCH transport system substrate-binding protein